MGPRGETLASVSPDIVEGSIVEPAPKAPAETEIQKFERYYNQAKQQFEESQKGRPSLAPVKLLPMDRKICISFQIGVNTVVMEPKKI